MKILLTGGTGFIGRALVSDLVSSGHELVVLTRLNKESSERLTFIHWSYKWPEDITAITENVDLVINLAGESIVQKKWTEKQKENILKSRVLATRKIVSAINQSAKKPKKLISASAIGIYGTRSSEIITEKSTLGSDFLSNVCKAWEEEALKVEIPLTILRIGVVLNRSGGVLRKLVPQFKMFLGGSLGSGTQWMSWISLRDVAGLIRFAIQNEKVTGILNAVSPNPVTNKTFSVVLGKVLNRPSFFSVPEFVLKFALGEMADLLLTGQKVYPERALMLGYQFKHTDLEEALKEILLE